MASEPKLARFTFSSNDSSSDQHENEETYKLKRHKNNEAVKKSREKSRQKKEEVTIKMDVLKKENSVLETQIETLSEELATLKKNLMMIVVGKKKNIKLEKNNVYTDSVSRENEVCEAFFENKPGPTVGDLTAGFANVASTQTNPLFQQEQAFEFKSIPKTKKVIYTVLPSTPEASSEKATVSMNELRHGNCSNRSNNTIREHNNNAQLICNNNQQQQQYIDEVRKPNDAYQLSRNIIFTSQTQNSEDFFQNPQKYSELNNSHNLLTAQLLHTDTINHNNTNNFNIKTNLHIPAKNSVINGGLCADDQVGGVSFFNDSLHQMTYCSNKNIEMSASNGNINNTNNSFFNHASLNVLHNDGGDNVDSNKKNRNNNHYAVNNNSNNNNSNNNNNNNNNNINNNNNTNNNTNNNNNNDNNVWNNKIAIENSLIAKLLIQKR